MRPYELPTDLITPLGAYLRLRDRAAGAFLLESVERGRLGRHSLVGCGSRLCDVEEAEASLEAVVGYVAYDFVAGLEPTVPLPAEGAGLPVSRFVVADTLVRFDHALGVAHVLAGDPNEVARRLGAQGQVLVPGTEPWPEPTAGATISLRGAEAAISAGHVPMPGTRTGPNGTRREPEQGEFEAAVRTAQEHIRAGDAFQIVVSQRASRPTRASAVELYRALRRVNPSPYLFLLELDELALIGSSPETLVKVEGRRASLNPIAGTTRRGPGDAERLLSSEKDRAEHVMLVDLGRNDLSRVCTPGTVRVARFLEVEPYSHVTHLVSQVDGELRDGVSHFDVLRSCFPAGTVSGAPKVRAMQLISELEGVRRGPYGGAVGYAIPGETLDTCITIRTIVLRDGVASMQAGAGIVSDSEPSAEHEECLRKLAAVEAAIDMAEGRR
jgi:anthranilate synthase component I